MRRLLLLALLLVSCREHHHDHISSDRAAQPAPPLSTSSQSAPAPAASSSVKITDAAGKDVVTINDNGSTATIDFATQRLTGTMRETGKRKYALANGPVILEVKPHENGFKVRTPDGKLLWKVKLDDKKIKISNNEQNENATELRDVISGNTAQFHISGPPSIAYGVLQLKDIPAMQQYVIMTELLARHR
jgi:hypothetical protein